MKKLSCFALPILLCALLLSGCVKPDGNNIKADSIYNKELGTVISLGMTKDAIDKLLGACIESPPSCMYEGDVSVRYKDEKADIIVIGATASHSWVVRGDLGLSATVENVKHIYGEASPVGISNVLLYGVDESGKNLGTAPGTAHISLVFHLNSDDTIVESITIGKPTDG